MTAQKRGGALTWMTGFQFLSLPLRTWEVTLGVGLGEDSAFLLVYSTPNPAKVWGQLF